MRMFTNMAATLMFLKRFACLWLNVKKICLLFAIFSNQTFIITSPLMGFQAIFMFVLQDPFMICCGVYHIILLFRLRCQNESAISVFS
jgi:hypothetical protein